MNAVMKGLYVGDMSDVERAKREEMRILSVMWDGEDGLSEDVTRISTTRFITEQDGFRTYADGLRLNEAADWIHEMLQHHHRVLVQCAFGMERSPLTVVWYLMRHHRYTLDEAYRIVKINQPMVQDRRGWLPMNWETLVHDGVTS